MKILEVLVGIKLSMITLTFTSRSAEVATPLNWFYLSEELNPVKPIIGILAFKNLNLLG